MKPETGTLLLDRGSVEKLLTLEECMAMAKVVVDSLDQCCAIGDTHHAIAPGLIRREDVYAELCEIVAGKRPGRETDDKIIVFDSTGIAIEDAVAATAVYEKARRTGIGTWFDFNGRSKPLT